MFGNVGTMITFRVGAFDAEVLEKEFAPVFTAEDLVNLGFTQIYLKLMIDGVSSSPFSATTIGPIAKPEVFFKEDVINSSHAQFARPRAEVEEIIAKFHEQGRPDNNAQPGQNRMQNGNGGGQQGGGQGGGQNRGEYRGGERRDDRPQQSFQQSNQGSNQNYNQNRPPERRPDFSRTEFVEVPSPEIQKTVAPEVAKEDANKIAFLKAAEELKAKAVPVPQAVITPLVEPTSIIKPVEKVSLQSLAPEPKQNHEKAKVPTPENISSLKNALSAVLSKTTPPTVTSPVVPPVTAHSTPPVAKAPNIQPEAKQEPQKEKINELPKQPEYANVGGTVREVPEDVLRNLLSMDK